LNGVDFKNRIWTDFRFCAYP